MRQVIHSTLAVLMVMSMASSLLADDCTNLREQLLTTVEDIPTSWGELAPYDPATRRAIFATLSPQEKSSLWTSHLVHYTESHPGLTESQLRVIEHAISMATPEIFSIDRSDILWEAVVAKPLEGLRDSAQLAFSGDELHNLFFLLGPSSGRSGAVLGLRHPICACSGSVDFCGSGEYCKAGGCAENWGCGLLWLQKCTGLCVPVP